MLWSSNITLITTINAVYLGTRQEGFPGISSEFGEEFTEINQSLTQGRVLPLSPTMTDKTEVSRFHVLFQVYWRCPDSRPRCSRV